MIAVPFVVCLHVFVWACEPIRTRCHQSWAISHRHLRAKLTAGFAITYGAPGVTPPKSRDETLSYSNEKVWWYCVFLLTHRHVV
jgi:hypothetical protein